MMIIYADDIQNFALCLGLIVFMYMLLTVVNKNTEKLIKKNEQQERKNSN